MANKAISELPQAQNVNNQDLFVLEQGGLAKKLTAETFITEQGIIDALAEALDGHGGIQSVTLSSVSGRIRTYLITFTDQSATTFQVLDGTTIDSIAKTSTAGLVDTYTIFMSDGTTSFFQVTNGSKGDPGVVTDEQVTTAVDEWLDDNVMQETGYVLDSSLTMSNAAAPADLVGNLKSAYEKSIETGIKGKAPTYTIISGSYIKHADGGLTPSENFSYTDYIYVKNATKIRYTRTSHTINAPSVGIAFYNENKTYVSGVPGLDNSTRPAQRCLDLTDVPVPNNAVYVRLSVLNSDSSSFYVALLNDLTDAIEEIALDNGEYVYHPSIAQFKHYINDSGVLTTSTIQNLTNPLPVRYGHIYRLKLNIVTQWNMRINGLTKDATYIYNKNTYVKKIFATISPPTNSTISIDFIVNDKRINNVAIAIRNDTSIVSFEDIGKFNDDGLGLHSIPSLRNAIGLVKRARHFTDILWTPTVDLPRFSQLSNEDYENLGKMADEYSSGKTYKGLPYSSGNLTEMPKYGYTYGHIGYDAPLSAFITSLYNANSFLNTNSPGTETEVQSTAYGATCDSLVCYAMGLNTWYGSDVGFAGLVNNGTIVSITTVDSLDDTVLEIGDILFKQAVHVAIITDIQRDDNGDIVFIEVSEATTKAIFNTNIVGGDKGGLCRREAWNLTEFAIRFAGYGVYRYPNLYTKTYEQCPYVAVGDEMTQQNLYLNMPIIPFMGEGFVYKTGKIQNNTLLSQASGYSYIAVYKDGALFNTYSYAATLSVPFTEAGSYEAFLFNGTIESVTKKSLSCHWTVI